MVGLLTGEKEQPAIHNISSTTETSITGAQTISEDYLKWRKDDRLLRGWIIGTLTEEALGLVIGLESSQTVWSALKEAYAQESQEREFNLRQQLTYLRKDSNESVAEYLRKFKGICDSLAAIGNPVPDKTKVYCLLANLGPKYESFTTTMLKPPMPSYSEAVSLLQGFEQRITWLDTSNSPSYAFYGQRNQRQYQIHNNNTRQNHSFNSRGRGFQATSSNLRQINQVKNHPSLLQILHSRHLLVNEG
ncbi:hypothetical protein F511_14870 [Dorcoceras hygrometricum]|uniref:Retrotransposon gag domain-containing protein n=1 Tax=Dorcoceras hygrometricum TaxID=472368 RepID=A0A2Z7AQP2_9LAMI|nr:hypothetical protein F511_14870 [Dorcoceras hygrometricum]